MKLVESRYRGYLRVEVTPERMQVDLRAMESIASREAPCTTLSTWVVQDGKPGPQRA